MYNSDGYILIDLSSADMSKSNQYMPGLYHRVTVDCIGVNKLALVINAGDLTPMSAVINKSLNYYVITTSLYIFKINSNDILIIEEAGSSTVEVAIVPTLIEGTKIADFQVGSTIGALYVPPQQSEINDNVPSDHTTYSSDKINTLLSGKANSSDLATVATTGSYTDLTNKPTIPTKVSELQNDSGYVAGSSLATVATTGSYTDLSNTPNIPTKVSELQNDSGYITGANYYTKTEVDTALSGITLNSNPATGDYHFELSTGWSVTNFMFSRQGNRCYLSGVFTCSTPISTWQFIGKFANLPVSKNINPLTELIVFVGADNEPDTPTSRSFARIVLRSTDGYLQASNDMPTARRLFISISWIAQTDEV